MIDNTPLRVFDEQVMELLGGLSAELLKSPLVRAYPDLAAFAFYIRKANLLKLRDALFPVGVECGVQSADAIEIWRQALSTELSSRLGRGLCFHIAPGNIPVNFAFTWVFGLLAGNANIVRLPSRSFPQVDALLEIIKRHLSRNQKLETRNIFVRYPRSDAEQTAKYCAMADCRMIWGGDRTIAAIKAMPTSPRCVDIAFADRYSLAIIDGAAVLASDDPAIGRLAENFYNDTWLMDQNACSSPQVICWEHDSPEARARFWSAAENVARVKYRLQDAIAVDKYTLLCEEAISNENCCGISRFGNLLYREELSALTPDVINHRGKAGYFFEYSLSSVPGTRHSALDTLFPVITEKFQTITYFGVDPHALREALMAANVRGIDRIVPIGQAMNVGIVWDGHDLVRELSRIISVS